MKTLKGIINSRPIYLNDWAEDKKLGVISDFDDIYITQKEYEATEPPYANVEFWQEKKVKMKEALKRWKDIKILFASYGQANYSGDAWVLFTDGKKLFEVNAGHCSCYGLEGQWNPEEVVLEELEHRLLKGNWGEDNFSDNNFKQELIKFLAI